MKKAEPRYATASAEAYRNSTGGMAGTYPTTGNYGGMLSPICEVGLMCTSIIALPCLHRVVASLLSNELARSMEAHTISPGVFTVWPTCGFSVVPLTRIQHV